MITDRPVGVCSDHAGFALKEQVKTWLAERGFEVNDYGCHDTASCDYPDYAHPMGAALDNGELAFGVAVCSTGNGISMTLNKHQSVRAALCWDVALAQFARAHNDANVLVMPANFIAPALASKVLDAYLNTEFEGGRHQRRVGKIAL